MLFSRNKSWQNFICENSHIKFTRLEYLTDNYTLKNKPINGKNFYFIVNETDQNKPDISHEKIPCPVNFEMPSVDLTVPSKIELTEICRTTKIMYKI